MGKITFIVGGARSGKSSYALELAKSNAGKTAFVATCRPTDAEMRKRVRLHKNSRPKHWKTFQDNDNLPLLLRKISLKFEIVIIDCLTLLLSDFMLKGLNANFIEGRTKEVLRTLKKIKAESIIVSNEVGLGIVPENKLARDFRDIAGKMNQVVAKNSDHMFFLVCGIPWRIK